MSVCWILLFISLQCWMNAAVTAVIGRVCVGGTGSKGGVSAADVRAVNVLHEVRGDLFGSGWGQGMSGEVVCGKDVINAVWIWGMWDMCPCFGCGGVGGVGGRESGLGAWKRAYVVM